jgi:group I intron endonuclease
MYAVIYKIINNINGMIYIGYSTDYKSRMSQHKYSSKNPSKTDKFHLAVHKYGFENFSHYIIDWANDIESAYSKEVFWIAFYKSDNREFGYNIEPGGTGSGKHVRVKTKEKISKSISAENHPRAKLTWVDVNEIRENKDKLTRVEQSIKYNVYITAIHKIIHNQSWKISEEEAAKINKIDYRDIEDLTQAKFTWNDINDIRENKDQLSQKKLSLIYNVNECTIFNIINNISWKIPQEEFDIKYKENIENVSFKLKSKSQDARGKISKALTGKIVSKETRLKMSEGQKGKVVSEQCKQKMRENHPHLSGEDHPMYGKNHSDETKSKMSEDRKGDKNANSKLTEEEIHTIRCMYRDGIYSSEELAIMFNMKSGQIRKIVSNRAWIISEEEFEKYKTNREFNSAFKLNWQKVDEIRLNEENLSREQLSIKYNVSKSAIDNVRYNKTWIKKE